MMNTDTTRNVLAILRQQVIDTRAAYYRGVVEYEDMAASAERYLRMLAAVDKAAGRKPRPVTAGAVAHMLRAL